MPAARLGLSAVAPLVPKLRRGVEARRDLLDRWGRHVAERSRSTPVFWVHAASAGEALQAKPLTEAIRQSNDAATIWLTHFSPSAQSVVEAWECVDAADYLPFDVPRDTHEIVHLLCADALILVGGETWPNLVWEAADAGVRIGQASCRLVNSARLGWPARIWTRSLYAHLDAVGAVSEGDAGLLAGLGVEDRKVAVTGDTRVDATLARLADPDAADLPWTSPAASRVIVAGSTWPADEKVVLPVVARLGERFPGLVTLIAPHEPTGASIAGITRASERLGMRAIRFSRLADEAPPEVVVLDRVGVLYRAYRGAELAFVGGGFGGSVHNTMEPAALGVPVAIGPRHGSPREVDLLEASGGLASVETSEQLFALWEAMLSDPDRRESASRAARSTIESMAGATRRTIDLFRDRGFPI